MNHPLDRVLADRQASVTNQGQKIAGGAQSHVENTLQRAGVQVSAGAVVAAQSVEAETASGLAQIVVVNAAPEPRYFEIILYPAGDGPGAELPAVALDAGAAYRILVRASENPASGGDRQYTQNGVKVRDGVDLFLAAATPASGEAAWVEAEWLTFTAEQAALWTGEWKVVLPPGYADSTLVLRLQYLEQNAVEPSLAAERRYAVRPSPVAPALPAVHSVQARVDPPPRTAVLYLEPAGPATVNAWGFIPEIPDRPQFQSFPLPPPPAGPFEDVVHFSRRLADWMADLSRGATGELGLWLEEVLATYGEGCSVMIADDSGAAMPWELFLLRDDSRLGARARVVRWVTQVYRGRPLAWETAPVCVPRRLAAYLPDASSPLAASSALARAAAETCRDPDDLSDTLLEASERGAPVGVVYLGAGAGLAYDDHEQTALLAMSLPPPGAMHFRLRDVEGKLSPRPLVFANAPYSACVPRVGAQPVGLACALLSHVASGYIGVIGPVDAAFAAEFAEYVLDAANAGACAAEVLRALRWQAEQDSKNRSLSREQRRAAMVAFLYVYFGNPQVSIQQGEGDD